MPCIAPRLPATSFGGSARQLVRRFIGIPEGAKPRMTIIVTTPQSKEQVQMVVPEGGLPGAKCDFSPLDARQDGM